MLEEIELVIDQPTVELADAIGVTEEIRPRVSEIVPRRIGDIMGDFDLFHLAAIDRMGAKIAGNR
jgi:hypothetical protein